MINKINMRRPLCLAALIYVALALIAIYCGAGRAPTYEGLDRQRVVMAGYVDHREYRTSQGGDTQVISLTDAVILEESQTAILERFLSDSEKIPRYRLYHFWKKNRELVRREDAAGIEGVLCYMDGEYTPKIGSLVIVQGDYRAFTHATNPGEFDAADYYRIMGQQGRIMKCRCLAQSAACDVFREKLCRCREYLSLLTEACYDENDASVMKAMLLGEKGTLDAEIKELYKQNGIIHILAISGLHLSVIGMGFHKLLKKMRFPNVVSILLTIGLMYCFGTMTGMGVSMQRAYLMFGLHLCAGLVHRTYDLLTAVSMAVFLVLLQQPLYLQHSGFLFSFGAVCGIGIFLPAAKENLFGQSRLERVLSSGIAISIATLPVYLYFYYEFPPYSVLLNLVVIPCMTGVLLCGLISLGAAACFLPLGEAAAYPVHLMLVFYEKCCSFCLDLPDSQWVIGCPKTWQIAAFLGILAGLVAWNHRLSKLHFWQGVLCALFVLTFRMPQGLQITMVDVGQGDCIYLEEESGTRMLIDGGSSDKSNVEKYQMIPYLKHEGVSYLDAVVVTHPDSDHISGIRAMLEGDAGGITVGALYLPDVGVRSRSEAYHELEKLAGKADISVRYLGLGDRLHCGKIMLTCLNPLKGWETEDDNAYSTVLHLRYGSFTALFTGDLEGQGEKMVLDVLSGQMSAESPLTLLKVAHHGSRNSTGEAFLQAVNPQIALISAGRDNRYGHPHEELLERLADYGCRIYRTHEQGAVTIRVHRGRVQVETFLDG